MGTFPAKRENMYSSVKTVLQFLNILACSNVSVEHSPAPGGKRKEGALPFDSYKYLSVGQVSDGCSGGNGGGGGSHRSPREHLRRGHIRRLGTGKTGWINAMVVGRKEGAGRVYKKYEVKPQGDSSKGLRK